MCTIFNDCSRLKSINWSKRVLNSVPSGRKTQYIPSFRSIRESEWATSLRVSEYPCLIYISNVSIYFSSSPSPIAFQCRVIYHFLYWSLSLSWVFFSSVLQSLAIHPSYILFPFFFRLSPTSSPLRSRFKYLFRFLSLFILFHYDTFISVCSNVCPSWL